MWGLLSTPDLTHPSGDMVKWPYWEGLDAGVNVLMAPLCPCFSDLSVKAQDWARTAAPPSRLDTQIVGLGVLPVYGWYALSCTRKTSQAPGRSTHTHAQPSVNTNKIRIRAA